MGVLEGHIGHVGHVDGYIWRFYVAKGSLRRDREHFLGAWGYSLHLVDVSVCISTSCMFLYWSSKIISPSLQSLYYCIKLLVSTILYGVKYSIQCARLECR